MTWSPEDLDRLASEYAAVRQLYERLSNRVADLLTALVEEMNIEIHAVERRAKSVESFRDKVTRPEKSYADPLRDITDLAGVRLILYYSDDVAAVKKLIAEEFDVDTVRSTDWTRASEPDRFGYESVHLVAGLRADRKTSKEWTSVRDLVCEIQVRTVLQHAWAAVSHQLHYKQENESSDEWSRRLYRLVGMFELADEQFSTLRRERIEAKRKVNVAVSAGDLRLPINEVTLREYMHNSEVVRAIWDLAAKHRFVYQSRPESDDFTAELTRISDRAGVTTVEELQALLAATTPRASELFGRLTDDGAHHWWANEAFVTALMVLLARDDRVTSGDLVAEGWTPEVVEKVMNAIAATKQAG